METDASVWAKLGDDKDWFKAVVIGIEDMVQKRKKDTETLTKFTLDKRDDSNDSTGEIVEVISRRCDGSPFEFERVKLRNTEHDFRTDIEDLTVMDHLHEPAILNCIERRFKVDLIYTNTGPILIAVNPFKSLPIYDEKYVNSYRIFGEQSRFKDQTVKLSPHVYQVADRAYRSMVEMADRNIGAIANQSVLVSGESGAGKTVTTKFIMRYLADITRTSVGTDSDDGTIEKQVLQSNPILECFGNARTLRNDNSSRFGKFIEIKFAQARGLSYRIVGATIRTYLLEKVRLVRQSRGERNFHCFYELIKGGSAVDRKRWGLSGLDDFNYTNQSGQQLRRDGVQDKDQYAETRAAMNDMGFSVKEQEAVLDVVASVLHLGNLRFDIKTGVGEEEDGSGIAPSGRIHMDFCCALLGFNPLALEKVLCEKQIKTKEKMYIKRQSVSEAEFSRDALAKTVYGALFEWIVKRINSAMGADEHGQDKLLNFIGVLDIFGFESFDTNSFEQLCINYTNERLQQHFNQYVFNDEQKLYKREGINWSFIKFPDNDEVIDLLENRRQGIFALCDEQVLFPRATDNTLVNKFYQILSSHPRFFAGNAEVGRNQFVVKHFAGPVTYSSEGFLEKNRDVVRLDMANLLLQSTSWLVAQLHDFFRLDEESEGALASGGLASKPAHGRRSTKTTRIYTLSGEFRKQLNELMENICTTSPHYIRCLKPNSVNVQNVLDRELITEQLRCNGLLEAVRVSRAGYPNRFTYEQFGRRYCWLSETVKLSSPWKKESVGLLCESLAESILRNSAFVPSEDTVGLTDKLLIAGIQRGSSMVFLRRGTFDFLERGRLALQRSAAIKVQASFRRYICTANFQLKKRACLFLQCAIRVYQAKKKLKAMRKARAIVTIQRVARGFVARLHVSRTMPGISKLHEKLLEKRLERRRMEMYRLSKAKIIAKTWLQFTRKRKEERKRLAAVKIQAIIRAHLHKRLLSTVRSEFLRATRLELNALSVQLAEVKLAREVEREAYNRSLRQRSALSAEEVSAMRAKLDQCERELEVAKKYVEEWRTRAYANLRHNDEEDHPDFACDEDTLRRLITDEITGQLQKTAAEIIRKNTKIESLQIQNKTVLESESLAALLAAGAISQASAIVAQGAIETKSSTVNGSDLSGKLQSDLFDFDENIAKYREEMSAGQKREKGILPDHVTPFDEAELEHMLRPPLLPGPELDHSIEIQKRALAHITQLRTELDSAEEEKLSWKDKATHSQMKLEAAEGTINRMVEENNALRKQLAVSRESSTTTRRVGDRARQNNLSRFEPDADTNLLNDNESVYEKYRRLNGVGEGRGPVVEEGRKAKAVDVTRPVEFQGKHQEKAYEADERSMEDTSRVKYAERGQGTDDQYFQTHVDDIASSKQSRRDPRAQDLTPNPFKTQPDGTFDEASYHEGDNTLFTRRIDFTRRQRAKHAELAETTANLRDVIADWTRTGARRAGDERSVGRDSDRLTDKERDMMNAMLSFVFGVLLFSCVIAALALSS